MSPKPIGIFDSGIGGLTVFRAMAELLPHEDLIYLGDTARVPYGTKSAETVLRYALQNVRFLREQGVKMIVVACNTASAVSLEELRRVNEIPVLGVIEPGVAGALQATRTHRIGVIGTEATLRSEAYAQALRALDRSAFVVGASCPLFVPLVEEGWWEGEIPEKIVRLSLQDLLSHRIDTLILGCTHYPLLKKTLQKVAGKEVTLIDSAEETARAVAARLTQEGLRRLENSRPRREFLVTDSPERFRHVGALFLQNSLDHVRHVEI